MAYIPHNLRWSMDDYRNMEQLEDGVDVPIETLVAVYHAFYKNDNNFDNGLGFIDRLWEKLHRPFNLDWDVEQMKESIRNSNVPTSAYMILLRHVLTRQMVAYYGL